MTTYAEFLARKTQGAKDSGIRIDRSEIHPMLHDWQKEIVQWACQKGRAAIWADTGLGKTLMQIEWARLMATDYAERALIIAPLAVCQQTIREAAKIGVEVVYARDTFEASDKGITITNYERVRAFESWMFKAVVLDESSILKDVTAKTRDLLIEWAKAIEYRLCCTATPAPNDHAELCNHAEFLGAATRREMLATYFIHDDEGWRVKGHARKPLYRWMSGWAMAITKPSDLGYPDDDYILPPLTITPHFLEVNQAPPDRLFATDLGGVGGRFKIRRETLAARVGKTIELVESEPDEPWLLWCGLNDEAYALTKAIPGAVNVHGTLTAEEKAEKLLAFADGDIRYLVTKPSIAAFGLNWQHCARMAFVGLSDSYETYYQSIRRCWRYGQTKPVEVHLILSALEGQIAENVQRKEREAARVTAGLVAEMKEARHET